MFTNSPSACFNIYTELVCRFGLSSCTMGINVHDLFQFTLPCNQTYSVLVPLPHHLLFLKLGTEGDLTCSTLVNLHASSASVSVDFQLQTHLNWWSLRNFAELVFTSESRYVALAAELRFRCCKPAYFGEQYIVRVNLNNSSMIMLETHVSTSRGITLLLLWSNKRCMYIL